MPSTACPKDSGIPRRWDAAWAIDPINRLTGSSATGYLTLFALAGVAFLVGSLVILRTPAD